MRVHHELSVPLKITSVWMMPRIEHADHGAGDVADAAGRAECPPMTTAAIASSSRPMACRL